MLQILIADDHDIVREGLRRLLQAQPHWVICDEAATGREAVAKARQHRPQVVVTDLRMPGIDGTMLAREAKRLRPDIVVTTSFDLTWGDTGNVNHADHRAISLLVYEAWLRMGKKFALYYYEVSNGEDTVQFAPTHYVDIAGTEARKRLACYTHASQTPDKFYALQAKLNHPVDSILPAAAKADYF